MSVARTECTRRVVEDREVCVSRGETPWLFSEMGRIGESWSVLSRQVWILLLLEDSFAGPRCEGPERKKRRNQEGCGYNSTGRK